MSEVLSLNIGLPSEQRGGVLKRYARAVHQEVNREFFEDLLGVLEQSFQELGYTFRQGKQFEYPGDLFIDRDSYWTASATELLETQILQARLRLLSPRLDSDSLDRWVSDDIAEGYGEKWVAALLRGVFQVAGLAPQKETRLE
jgi:hypothetical protein